MDDILQANDLLSMGDEETEWLYYVGLGDGGYAQYVSYQPKIHFDEDEPEEGRPIPLDSIDDYDFSGERLHAYRWDETSQTLIFDNARYAELIAEQDKEQTRTLIIELTAQLRQSDSVVLEALEELLSATTLTGFLSALVTAAKNIHETILARNDIRERIEKLKEDVALK